MVHGISCQLVKKVLTCTEEQGSPQCQQKSVIGICPNQVRSIPHLHIPHSLRSILIITSICS